MKQKTLLRRALIGLLGVVVYIARCPIYRIVDVDISKAKGGFSNNGNYKQYKVYNFRGETLKLQNSSSATLIPTLDGQEHGAEVIWSARMKSGDELARAAAESMWIRLQRHGKIKASPSTIGETMPTYEQMNATLTTNFTQDELNSIDPGWKVFILEGSDQGIGLWPYWYMGHILSPLVGWKRVNYAERTTQSGRNMGGWVADMISKQDPSLPFDGYLGRRENYSEYLDRNEFNSIQRLHLQCREGFDDAIKEYVQENHQKEYESALNNHDLNAVMARLPRPMDVRNFWNKAWCNHQCSFRNQIADIVHSIPERHANITTSTNVIGQIHQAGRRNLNPGYVDGLMTTKIIVLAQRDGYEDQVRFDEALLSGALVMADPQIYMPHGVIDGENIVVYNSWSDLELKILYYLENEEERVGIGQRGRDMALTYHKSWQQAERLYLNDMTHKNEYGIFNKPWRRKSDFAL